MKLSKRIELLEHKFSDSEVTLWDGEWLQAYGAHQAVDTDDRGDPERVNSSRHVSSH